MKLLLKKKKPFILGTLAFVIFAALLSLGVFIAITYYNKFQSKELSLIKQSLDFQKELTKLKNEDQFLRNNKLETEIKNIQDAYKKSLASYERILDLRQYEKTDKFDEQFAKTLEYLSERNYSSASSFLASLDDQLKKEKFANSSSVVPENVTASNAPPASGYSLQRVNSDAGSFTVAIVSGDLNSTRVTVDTASESDCKDNCPVLPLSDYVSRNQAYAGINGSYFCPATYPTCAGKTNSFDLLVMNKNKTYFNSDNNVYSTNPLVVFLGSSVRFVVKGSDWGRDNGNDGVLMNYPMLLGGGNVVYGGDADAKHNNKGGRSFVANKGNTVYIGVVFNATVMESAKTLQALGMENALNLDDGGSTALWFQGYKAGPGRNIPNAILFIRK